MSLELLVEVLVVDDSSVDRTLIKGLLEKKSYFTAGFAANGSEALEFVEQQVPQLVVTDLQMPEMNGIELVRELRHRHPCLPVILTTAHGSEETALRALREGAVSYVPKTRLADELVPTIEHVLARVHDQRKREWLLDCVVRSDTTYEMGNDPALTAALVDHIQQELTRMEFCDAAGVLQIGSAVEAALLNALYHGNLELEAADTGTEGADLALQRRQQAPYKDRKIRVQVAISEEQARFVVQDEGAGFDHQRKLGTTAAGFVGEGGRGISLLQAMMDEVCYNEKGNEVTLVKNR